MHRGQRIRTSPTSLAHCADVCKTLLLRYDNTKPSVTDWSVYMMALLKKSKYRVFVPLTKLLVKCTQTMTKIFCANRLQAKQ